MHLSSADELQAHQQNRALRPGARFCVTACIVPRMRTVATIGVYGWTLEGFLDALHDAEVGLLVDVRQRRGVRGREYSWANAQRLQPALAEAGIGYSHHRELAPTTELRHVQYREDDRLRVGKRSRSELAPEYRERYLHEILEQADVDALVEELPRDRASALFCVEHDPEACHRSLVAERLAEAYGVKVVHLR